MTLQNVGNFTVFFGPPSPKAMARQGHLIQPALQLQSSSLGRGQFKFCGLCALCGKIASGPSNRKAIWERANSSFVLCGKMISRLTCLSILPFRGHCVISRRRGEPIGSGAIESTCRQAQCRFKRPGQYWSPRGDESLLCLETSSRSGRWHLLFPHNRQLDPSKN
jgi:hypothetical protein